MSTGKHAGKGRSGLGRSIRKPSRISVPGLGGYGHLWADLGKRTGLRVVCNDPEAGIQGVLDGTLVIHVNPGLNREAFWIDASRDRMVVRASTVEGLWRGMNTRATSLTGGVRPIRGSMKDWPAMSMRGAHLDLTYTMYTPEFLMGLLPQFSALSVNTLLLDISDKLVFPGLETLAHPDALPMDFWRKFGEEATRWFIEVIPTAQTFGHMGNYLKHADVKDLREKPDSSAVLCPSDKRSLEFIERLIDGVRQAFPKSRFIHAGLDEVGYSGQCPRCRGRYARLGYGGIYREHIKRVHRMVRRRGARMMMWADMLVAYPEVCEGLPRDIVINDWQYLRYAGDETTWFVFTGMKTPSMQETGGKDDLDAKFPADLRAEYDAYLCGDDDAAPFKGYPYLRYFLDKGFDVVGSPASKCFGSHFAMPMYEKRLPNVLSFTAELAKNGAMGVINTNWSPRGTHFMAASFPGYVAGALAAWKGNASIGEIDDALGARFLAKRQAVMKDFLTVGRQILTLTRYGWSEDPEHFSMILQDKFKAMETELRALDARKRRSLIASQKQIARAAERLITWGETSCRHPFGREVALACGIILIKLREERLLLGGDSPAAVRLLLKDLRKMRDRVHRAMGKTLAPSSLGALRRVLFDGSFQFWRTRLEAPAR